MKNMEISGFICTKCGQYVYSNGLYIVHKCSSENIEIIPPH